MLPRKNTDTQPFWAACAEKRLVFQRCPACGKLRWPASVVCPECHSTEFELSEVEGRGEVYSYVVFHRAMHPDFEGKTPYNIAAVDLDCGVRLLSRVEGDCRCGMRVILRWQPLEDGGFLPVFEEDRA